MHSPLVGDPHTLHKVKPVQGANAVGSQPIGLDMPKQLHLCAKSYIIVQIVRIGALEEPHRAIDMPK